MTTFQDPPLQSRRAVRQNERDGQPSGAPSSAAPGSVPPEPLTYATTQRPPIPEYDGPGFRSHRTADPAPPAEAAPHDGTFRPRDFSPEGRRVANPTWAPQYGGVDDSGSIEYHTQARVDTPAAPEAQAAVPAAAAPSRPMPQPLPTDDAQIDAIEQTLTRRELRALRDAHGISATTTGDSVLPDAAAAAPVAAPVAQAPVAEAPVAQAPVAQAPAVAATLSAPPVAPAPAPSSRLDSALAEFDALAGNRPPADPQENVVRGRRAAVQAAPAFTEAAPAAQVAPAPVPLVDPMAAPPVQQAPVEAAPVQQAPVQQAPVEAAPVQAPPVQQVPVEQIQQAPAPQPVAEPEAPVDGLSAFDSLFTPTAPEPVVIATIEPEPAAPAPVAEAPVVQAPVAEAPVAQAPVAPAPQQTVVSDVNVAVSMVDDPSTATPPVGHWSTQAQLDDETQVGSATLSGSVGANSAPLTTSALVLPSIPDHNYGPLTSGDVILTGSISLPQSFSSTGAFPAQLDQSDLDHVLDPGDQQVASADSSPVRAIRAVSTHTSSRNVMGTLKPKGNRALTVLIIAAAAMAAVVVTLLIVGLVSGQL